MQTHEAAQNFYLTINVPLGKFMGKHVALSSFFFNSVMPPELSSERLTLQPLSVDDHQFIMELVNTKGWIEFIGDRNIHSKEDAVAYIERILSNADITYWVVRTKEDNALAGVITFIKREYLPHRDIGFAFLPEHAGKGYAYEATNVVLQHVAKDRSDDTVLATTLPHNFSSIKLLEKLGLRFSKQIVVDEQELYLYSMPIGTLERSSGNE